jgi:hypothetical protein
MRPLIDKSVRRVFEGGGDAHGRAWTLAALDLARSLEQAALLVAGPTGQDVEPAAATEDPVIAPEPEDVVGSLRPTQCVRSGRSPRGVATCMGHCQRLQATG